MYELKKNAFLGVLWGSGNYIFNQVILLAVKLILVRLLIPEEFGIAAMAWILISSLNLINAFGTGAAFIRDTDSKEKEAKNTLFYLDAAALTLIALIGFFTAPYVAAFFGKKITDPGMVVSLVWMIRLLALSQLLHILVIIPSNVLRKNLRFKEGVIAGVGGTFAYGIVAVVMAVMGFGAWAIIVGQLVSILIRNVITFSYVRFIPSLVFSKEIAKKYLGFGKNAFISSIVSIVIVNGDDTLIGRVVGSAALGFYSLGQHFAGLIVSIISGVVNGVMFPVFSKIQENKPMYSKAFFKAFRITNMMTIPAIIGAVILAEEVVTLVFGVQWLSIVPIFYVLSIATFLNNFVGLAGPVLNSLNKPSILRNNRLIQFGFYIVLIYPFVKYWGAIGVSIVMVIFALVSVVHYIPVLAKEVESFYKNMFIILSKVLFSTLVMAVVVYFVKKMFSVNWFSLIFLVLIGMVVYFSLMWLIDKENLRWDISEGILVLKEKFFKSQ